MCDPYSLPSNWKCQKHHATMEDDAELGPPEEIETDGNKDQASDSGKESKRKYNLSREN